MREEETDGHHDAGARPEEALPEEGVPPLRPVTAGMLREALRRGRADLTRAPVWGLFFAGVYVVIGWILAWVTLTTGQSYWLIFAACPSRWPVPSPLSVFMRCRAGWNAGSHWIAARS